MVALLAGLRLGPTGYFWTMAANGKGGAQASVPHRMQVLEGHQGAIYDLCMLEDGALVSAGGDGFLVRWSASEEGLKESGEAMARSESPVFSICALPDGGVRMGNAVGQVIDVEAGGQWRARRQHEGPATVVMPEGSGGADGCWFGQGEVDTTARFPGRIRAATRHGRACWIGTSEGALQDLDGGWSLQAHDGAVRAILPWPGKEAFATVGADGRMRLWSGAAADGPAPLLTMDVHKGAVYRAVASPDGRRVATCSRDRSVAIWDAANLDLHVRLMQPEYPGHRKSVNALCWLDARRLASAGDDGRILLWYIP